MQQINTERQQQVSVRLPRQLPANIIKETTSPIQNKNVTKISKSPSNRFEKLPGENQQQGTFNLDDLDTRRSLSSCPTYSSLSRHTPSTCECATQITTVTPTQIVEDNQEILNDSSPPIDNNQILVLNEIPVEEVELMPISSGFGYYPYNYPTTMTQRVVQPQISARAPQNKPNGKLPPPRPTAVKQQSPRSDTYVMPTKRNEINPKAPNNSRRPPPPPKEPAARRSSTPPERKRVETMRRNGVNRPIPKQLNSPTDQQDYGRKPLRFSNKHNSSSPPSSYQPTASTPRPPPDKSQRMRVANNEYVLQRRRNVLDPIYDDYRSESPIERVRPQRLVRVLRDASYRDDEDLYYLEPARRRQVVRRPSPTEYVYIDEAPSASRPRRSRHAEVVYIDEKRPTKHDDEYIYVDQDGNEVDIKKDRKHSSKYVDEDGNEIDIKKDRKHSSKHVEYVDDDDPREKRRSHKPKVVYVDDDDDDDDEREIRRSHKPKVVYIDDESSIDHGKNKKKSKHPSSSSTRIVYE